MLQSRLGSTLTPDTPRCRSGLLLTRCPNGDALKVAGDWLGQSRGVSKGAKGGRASGVSRRRGVEREGASRKGQDPFRNG